MVPKSLALRVMERIVGINRMLGGREEGKGRERERVRELFLVPPEKMSWHLFCAYLGGQSLAWVGDTSGLTEVGPEWGVHTSLPHAL